MVRPDVATPCGTYVPQGVASLGLRYSARRVVGLFPGLIAESIRRARARAFNHEAGKEAQYSSHAVQWHMQLWHVKLVSYLAYLMAYTRHVKVSPS